MKTSKIIFISLLGSVALIIMATTIDIKLTGHRGNTYPPDLYKTEKTGIPDFKVLSINNCSNIELIRNDSASIEVIHQKDSVSRVLDYITRGDTLFINDIRKSGRNIFSCKIHATGSLGQIVLKNSDINMKNLKTGNLAFSLDGSSISINNEKAQVSAISALDVSAINHSTFNTGEFRVDSINLVLQKSEVYLELIAEKIHGTLADSSKVYSRQVGEINLKKDQTSLMILNEN
jgi:hypothetical protein